MCIESINDRFMILFTEGTDDMSFVNHSLIANQRICTIHLGDVFDFKTNTM